MAGVKNWLQDEASKMMVRTSQSLPALAPPPGQVSNFDDPSESLQPVIIAALAFCLALTTLCVLVRSYAQLKLYKKLCWTDLWILLGWVSHAAFVAMLLVTLPYGAGHHQWDVRLSNYYTIEFYLYVSFVLYDLAIVGAKVAILLQLIDVFCNPLRGRFMWAARILILVNVIFYVALSLALIFQCRPIMKAWDPTVAGVCVNQDSLLTSSGPFNIISDFLIWTLPLVPIWQLKMKMRSRIIATTFFTLGFFGCVCSTVRVVYSKRLSTSGDATWLIMQNQLWANAEITVGIVLASCFIVPRLVRTKRLRNSQQIFPGSDMHPLYQNPSGGTGPGNTDATIGDRGVTPQSKRSSRDPYFELAEMEREIIGQGTVVDDAPAAAANNQGDGPEGKKQISNHVPAAASACEARANSQDATVVRPPTNFGHVNTISMVRAPAGLGCGNASSLVKSPAGFGSVDASTVKHAHQTGQLTAIVKAIDVKTGEEQHTASIGYMPNATLGLVL